jgi:hypothetical protein
LKEGRLFKKIALNNNQVSLSLTDKFADPKNYRSINTMLNTMYQSSELFQEQFIEPVIDDNAPYLIIREGYKIDLNSESVKKALIGFAKPNDCQIFLGMELATLLDALQDPLKPTSATEAIGYAKSFTPLEQAPRTTNDPKSPEHQESQVKSQLSNATKP